MQSVGLPCFKINAEQRKKNITSKEFDNWEGFTSTKYESQRFNHAKYDQRSPLVTLCKQL